MVDKTFEIELLDGKHQLKFDNKALYRFEEVQGMSAPMVMIKNMDSIRALNHFIWAGLLHENPNLSVSDVIDKVDSHRLTEYGRIISEAVNYAFDAGDEPKKKAK